MTRDIIGGYYMKTPIPSSAIKPIKGYNFKKNEEIKLHF